MTLEADPIQGAVNINKSVVSKYLFLMINKKKSRECIKREEHGNCLCSII